MKKKHLIFFSFITLAALILASAGSAARPSLAAPLATTWFVDAAAGNDGNDCLTAVSACQHVNEALNRAIADDIIQIAAGIYSESIDISVPLTLIGAGTDTTFLDGGNAQRVLTTANNPVNIQNLTVRNGRITDANGGGIFNIGTLILQNVHVVDNTAVNGGGGGIFNGGTLILTASEVNENSSDSAGGGIFTWTGSTTTINVSRISSNSGQQGGGLYNLGLLDMSDSTVSDNSATGYSGGGLIIIAGDVSLNRVTFSGNQTVANGGAISNQIGTLSLTNSTLSGNSASQFGGLANESANAQTTVLNSTIAYNTASGSGTQVGGVGNSGGTMSLQNSIVAENDGRNCSVADTWISLGNNLSNDPHCGFTISGDLANTPANLAPLASFNGSSTEMHGLLPNSAAIDGGDNNSCPSTDQRSVNRPVDGNGSGTAVCDMGSFEARNQLIVSDVTVEEGDNGTTTAVFTVTLFPPSSQPVMVDYATADETAVAGSDYTAASGSLTFAPGETERFVSVDVTGDLADEPDKTFLLNLSNASDADILDGQGMATIVDNDGFPSLAIADVAVNEGNNGLAIAQFTLTLSPASADDVTVAFATQNGTAVSGSDYVAANGTITFSPGETVRLIEISINSDAVDEGDSESFTVQLSNPTNANVAEAAAVGTIVDDDTARVGLQPGPSVNEGQSGTRTAVFYITLTTPAAFPVTVDFYTASSSGSTAATPGVDYESTSGTLNFAPGETSQTVDVTFFGDRDEEPDEQFNLYLSNANPIPIYANVSTATILNDEGVNVLYLPLVANP